MARVIAGSVAAGMAAAVFLVAVVFAGAAEATITGSLLVAFGLGWALLGWAATRFTSRPLRWTPRSGRRHDLHRPRLLVFTPQDAAMRTP